MWYHMLRGVKEFVLLKPTQRNLAFYERWLCLPRQARVFFPELVTSRMTKVEARNNEGGIVPVPKSEDDDIMRVALKEGQTMYIPAGWIHAVYTREDSIALGGNFMQGCGNGMTMQLRINDIETRTQVKSEYTFPYFWPLQFYAGGMYLERLRATKDGDADEDNDKESRTPTAMLSQKELDDLPAFIDGLQQWWKEHPEQQEGLALLQQCEHEKGKSRSSIFHQRRGSTMPPTARQRNSSSITMEADAAAPIMQHKRISRKELTSAPNTAAAVQYCLKNDGCISIEGFFQALRTERDRVAEEREEKTTVAAPFMWSLPATTKTAPPTQSTKKRPAPPAISPTPAKKRQPSIRPPPPPLPPNSKTSPAQAKSLMNGHKLPSLPPGTRPPPPPGPGPPKGRPPPPPHRTKPPPPPRSSMSGNGTKSPPPPNGAKPPPPPPRSSTSNGTKPPPPAQKPPPPPPSKKPQ